MPLEMTFTNHQFLLGNGAIVYDQILELFLYKALEFQLDKITLSSIAIQFRKS